jgi:hypothetical protein
MRVTWKSFSFTTKEWRRNVLIVVETLIVMSLLIFYLVPLLVLRLASFRDLTITPTVLVHERMTLCLDALVMAHVLIVVIVPRVGTIFLL